MINDITLNKDSNSFELLHNSTKENLLDWYNEGWQLYAREQSGILDDDLYTKAQNELIEENYNTMKQQLMKDIRLDCGMLVNFIVNQYNPHLVFYPNFVPVYKGKYKYLNKIMCINKDKLKHIKR